VKFSGVFLDEDAFDFFDQSHKFFDDKNISILRLVVAVLLDDHVVFIVVHILKLVIVVFVAVLLLFIELVCNL